MPAGRGASTSSFAPGTITVKSGGVFKSSTTAAYWSTPTSLIINSGAEFNSAVSGVTSLPSTLVLNPNSTVRYSLSAAQPLAAGISTYENLIVTNPGIKSLATNTTVNGVLSLRGSATFSLNGFTLTYAPTAGLQYGANGQTTPQTTSDDEWPGSGSQPSSVTIFNTGGVNLHASRTITGLFTLSAGTLNLGTSNLVAINLSGGSATAFINTNGTGTFTLKNVGPVATLLPVGFTSYNPVTISNTGALDDFTVNVSPGSPCNTVLGNSVNRTWNISEATAGGSTGNVTLQWNGADETVSFQRNNSAVVSCNGSSIDQVGTTGPASGVGPYSQTLSNVSAYTSFGVTNSLIDFSAISLITPSNGGCKTSTEAVTVSIKNNSTVAIDFERNNLPVTVTATGGYTSTRILTSGILQLAAVRMC